MKCCIVSRLIATESWRICCLPFMHPPGIISSQFSFFLQILSPQTVSFARAKLFSSPKSISILLALAAPSADKPEDVDEGR